MSSSTRPEPLASPEGFVEDRTGDQCMEVDPPALVSGESTTSAGVPGRYFSSPDAAVDDDYSMSDTSEEWLNPDQIAKRRRLKASRAHMAAEARRLNNESPETKAQRAKRNFARYNKKLQVLQQGLGSVRAAYDGVRREQNKEIKKRGMGDLYHKAHHVVDQVMVQPRTIPFFFAEKRAKAGGLKPQHRAAVPAIVVDARDLTWYAEELGRMPRSEHGQSGRRQQFIDLVEDVTALKRHPSTWDRSVLERIHAEWASARRLKDVERRARESAQHSQHSARDPTPPPSQERSRSHARPLERSWRSRSRERPREERQQRGRSHELSLIHI
jgi:hypothetical protein